MNCSILHFIFISKFILTYFFQIIFYIFNTFFYIFISKHILKCVYDNSLIQQKTPNSSIFTLSRENYHPSFDSPLCHQFSSQFNKISTGTRPALLSPLLPFQPHPTQPFPLTTFAYLLRASRVWQPPFLWVNTRTFLRLRPRHLLI